MTTSLKVRDVLEHFIPADDPRLPLREYNLLSPIENYSGSGSVRCLLTQGSEKENSITTYYHIPYSTQAHRVHGDWSQLSPQNV